MSDSNTVTVMEAKRSLPGFVKGWAIADLVFCVMRLLIIPISLLGLLTTPSKNPLAHTFIYELIFGIMIFVFGLWANIGILAHKRHSLFPAYVCVAATVGSFLVVVVQIAIKISYEKNASYAIGMVACATALLILRGVLLGFYCTALKKTKAFFGAKKPKPEISGLEYAG